LCWGVGVSERMLEWDCTRVWVYVCFGVVNGACMCVCVRERGRKSAFTCVCMCVF